MKASQAIKKTKPPIASQQRTLLRTAWIKWLTWAVRERVWQALQPIRDGAAIRMEQSTENCLF